VSTEENCSQKCPSISKNVTESSESPAIVLARVHLVDLGRMQPGTHCERYTPVRTRTLIAVIVMGLLSAGHVYAKKPSAGQALPAYHVGITGLYVVPERQGAVVTVSSVEPGSPAEGKFTKGEVIVAVNGTKLALPDSRVQLGDAITAAEAADGKLTFTVKRGESTQQITLAIPVLGAYAKTWPVDCVKTRKIVEAAAARAVKRFAAGELKFPSREGAMNVLFLLSTGKAEHVEAVRAVMHKSALTSRSHTWNNGFISITLGEYYLRTGDKRVLEPLQAIVDDSYRRMTHGGWGHWDFPNPGYVRSGLVNAAGGPLFVGMVLARECGVRMSDASFKRNLKYFYRFVGFGGIPYGDQRPGGGAATNGKSGMGGVGYSLLGEQCYQMAAGQYALEQADSYDGFEGGHTGNMTNVLWRGLSAVHVPKSMQHHYRRHMDKLRWYYELCRHPSGGFRLLPTQSGEGRYSAPEWGMCAGLAFTAPWRNLRITGAPPTKYSKVRPVGVVMAKNADFVTPRHAEGLAESEFEDIATISSTMKWSARKPFYKRRKTPAEPLRKVKEDDELPSISYIVKHFRHYNPVARVQAAGAIGYHGDKAIPEILKALVSADARVRRAALEGLSGYHYFFMEKSPFTYTHAGIEKVVPRILEILADPKSDMWEIEGALWAISNAAPETIAKHLPQLTKFLTHEEWWVRSAAFVAISDAGKLAAPAMGDLFDAFGKSSHVSARNDYGKRLDRLINEDKVPMTTAVRSQAVRTLGKDLVDLTDRESSYVKRGTGHHEIGNVRLLLSFARGDLGLITDNINQELARLGNPNMAIIDRTNYQNLGWLLIGDQWGNPGLVNVIATMDAPTRAKLMPGLKALLAGGLDKMFNPKRKKGQDLASAVEKMKQTVSQMIAEHEKQHGPVKAYPVK